MEPRPYLIFPKLIEQATWGGKYIAAYKGWENYPSLQSINIGQSYELSGTSKLSISLTDSSSPKFVPENEVHDDALFLSELSETDARLLLGPIVFEQHKKVPLLIKFTQAKGNSFQLHKKPEVQDSSWLPKAESWYFFEDGYMTFGIKPGVSLEEYKKTCLEIDKEMQMLSKKVISEQTSLYEAQNQAKKMIKEKNPWQYINVYHVSKFTMVDLSIGGLHHSWEEDPASAYGNIVYEVQQDAPDDSSTLRSFDQGKLKSDGTIRPLTIEKYFQFLDVDPDHNDVEKAKRLPQGNRILTTKNYFMDLYTVFTDTSLSTGDSFTHLFVREGDIAVTAGGITVRVTKGHSCIIPQAAKTVNLHSNVPNSVVIRTGI